MLAIATLGAVAAAGLAFAEGNAPVRPPPPGVEDARRAKSDYLLNCMGCHGETGVGFHPNVPSMRGPMAKFARTPDGRAYLMRIPGVTQTSLTPERVAEVLNWSLHEFNSAADVAGIRPFTADEIAAARKQPLLEVVETRAKLASQAY